METSEPPILYHLVYSDVVKLRLREMADSCATRNPARPAPRRARTILRPIGRAYRTHRNLL